MGTASREVFAPGGDAMRKAVSIVAISVSVGGLLVTASGVATAAPIKAKTCNVVDASKAMNDLPASADCVTAATGTRAAQAVRPATSPVSPTTTIGSAHSFDRTNGDILAITKVQGAAAGEIAFGGNFSAVITPDGVSHSAKNFAIVSESTGAVLYAGNANSYVRSITSLNGVTYVGGDFSSFGGQSRSHAAALSSTFGVTSWNPKPTATVRALAAAGSDVFMAGGFSAVRAVSTSTGSTLWSKSTSGGDVHSLLAVNGNLYAGGLFEKYNGTTQHGLVKITPSSGSLVTAFNAHFRTDTGVGQYGAYDGEEIISLAAGPNSGQILAGSGGHAPAGDSSNEAILLNANTGSRVWTTSTIGDCQAIGLVGSTVVAGYHRNNSNTTTPFPYFATQLELSNGRLTTWDPGITGNQSNADGGNNGVQAMYVDQSTSTLFVAGAFTSPSSHKSLIVFSF
jgi:trimeric autotransporter adhesin